LPGFAGNGAKIRKDVLNSFFTWFGKTYPRPAIFQKPIELVLGFKQSCIVAFGDPLENRSYVFEWMSTRIR
jgi:hypothetical protein